MDILPTGLRHVPGFLKGGGVWGLFSSIFFSTSFKQKKQKQKNAIAGHRMDSREPQSPLFHCSLGPTLTPCPTREPQQIILPHPPKNARDKRSLKCMDRPHPGLTQETIKSLRIPGSTHPSSPEARHPANALGKSLGQCLGKPPGQRPKLNN